jgi:hypothetical protein
MKLIWFNLILCLGLGACAGSYSNMVVEDRLADYETASTNYHVIEKDYVNTLYNLDRYPDDEYLLEKKKFLRKQLEDQRRVLIQSRDELDKALKDWEEQIANNRDGVKEINDEFERARSQNSHLPQSFSDLLPAESFK